MKRILLSIFAIAGLSLSGLSAPLTPGEALQRAGKSGLRKAAGLNSQKLQLSHTFNTEKGEAAVYVFNSSNSDGYIILSADDVAAPILGYADSGEFDYATMPAQMKWWLEQYARQIEYACEHNFSVLKSRATDSDWKAIAPMTKTRWNQDAPYNNDCPIYPNTKQRSVTGCVATAMAQVLNYWKQPETGKGSISYSPNGYITPLTMDFSAQKFDWDNMLNTYLAGQYNEKQAAAVAYLMKACGYSVQMSYSSVASGAQSYNVGSALMQNFGYNDNLSYEQRDYYTISDWNKLIYDELAAGRPVLYAGQSDGGGHEFVCDGYSDGFFHINWGWGGMSDGYFLLESLSPDAEGIGGGSGGFNYMQDILKCVQPTECANPDRYSMVQRGSLSASVSGTRVTPRLSGASSSGIWYWQYGSFSCSIGMEITLDGKEDSKTYVNVMSGTLKSRTGYSTLQSITFPSTLGDGKYKCRLVCRNGADSNSEWRYVKSMPGMANYFYITKAGSTLTVENIEAQSLALDELSLSGKLYYQCLASINATFSNPSTTELSAVVVPVVTTTSGSVLLEGGSVPVTVAPGGKETFNWNTSFELANGVKAPTTATDGILRFRNKTTGVYYSAQLPVTIQINMSVSPSVTNFKILDATRGSVEGYNNVWIVTNPDAINTTFILTNRSGYFGYPTYLYVVDPSTNYIVQSTALSLSGLDANKSLSGKGTMSFPSGEDNKVYLVGVMYYGPMSNGESGYMLLSQSYMTIQRPSGVEEIDAEADVTEEYYDLQGRKLNATPERGIYIVKRGEKVTKVIR